MGKENEKGKERAYRGRVIAFGRLNEITEGIKFERLSYGLHSGCLICW